MTDANSTEPEENVVQVFKYQNVVFLDIGTMLEYLTLNRKTIDEVDVVPVRLGLSNKPETVLPCAS